MPALPPPRPPAVDPQGVAWSAVPIVTLGMGSPFSFVYAANRHRSAKFAAAGVGYGAGYVAVFTTALPVPLAIVLFMTLWVTSSVHALVVRRELYPRRTPRDRMNQHAIEVAQYRRSLREAARRLLAEDPALAAELLIGRPDLPRGYDDGGLIDVNHVPAPTLRLLPGIEDELAEKIVRIRTEQGTFVSVEELGVDADLSPDLVQRIAEYTIFIR
jgi:DNA uptake protein ComE-like DNA-binding protein